MLYKLRRGWRSLKLGVRNIIRWTPVIWGDVDWDWSSLAEIIIFKLDKMAIEIGEHGHHIGREKTAKQMLVCRDLMRRILADNYFENAKRSHDESRFVKHSLMMEKQDLEYFGKLFGKYFRQWWD